MSVATASAVLRLRLMRTISRALPRVTAAIAHAQPTLPVPIIPIFILPFFRRLLSRRFGGLAAENPDRNRLGRRRAALSIPAVERDQSVGFWVIGGVGTARHIVRHHLESAGDALPVVDRGGLWVDQLLWRGLALLPFLTAKEQGAAVAQ